MCNPDVVLCESFWEHFLVLDNLVDMANYVYILLYLSPDRFAGAADVTHHMHKLVNKHEIIGLSLEDLLNRVKQLAIQQLLENFF